MFLDYGGDKRFVIKGYVDESFDTGMHQLIAPPFNINTYLVCDLESSRSVSKLAST